MLTVEQLRKALKGVKGYTPVYVADHDHALYETSGPANKAELMNQKDASPWDLTEKEFEIVGNYFVIRG